MVTLQGNQKWFCLDAEQREGHKAHLPYKEKPLESRSKIRMHETDPSEGHKSNAEKYHQNPWPPGPDQPEQGRPCDRHDKSLNKKPKQESTLINDSANTLLLKAPPSPNQKWSGHAEITSG
jgi:hypothetical protein